jgi:hypothetical protein
LQIQRCLVCQEAPEIIDGFPGFERQRHRGRPIRRIPGGFNTSASQAVSRQVRGNAAAV